MRLREPQAPGCDQAPRCAAQVLSRGRQLKGRSRRLSSRDAVLNQGVGELLLPGHELESIRLELFAIRAVLAQSLPL